MAIKKRDRKRKEKRQLIRKDVYSDGEDEVDHSRLDNVQDNQYHIEHINKNDDEEIDEDEAFNSQDEAKFGEYFTNSKVFTNIKFFFFIIFIYLEKIS